MIVALSSRICAACADSLKMFDASEQLFVESFRAACMELEVCWPGDRVDARWRPSL